MVKWICRWAILALVFSVPISSAGTQLVVDLADDPDAVRFIAGDIGDEIGSNMVTCDLNGDGIQDLIITAPESDGPDNGRTFCGEVYVFYGRRGRWTGPIDVATQHDVWIYGQYSYDSLGDGLGCGDVNGDGYDDLVIAAPFGDGPGRTRDAAGQAHIIFGGPALPAEIDLLANPGKIIYGDVVDGQLGNVGTVAVGDVNGNGIPDVLLGASNTPSRNGEILNAGRMYVVFGRLSWPATFDLRTRNNVTIYGHSLWGGLGRPILAADYNEDGTSDILVGETGFKGPDGSRTDAGAVDVFVGRSVWPAIINLGNSEPDMRVHGADAHDGLCEPRGLAVGDLDGDGHPDGAFGAFNAAGRTETAPDTGEVRTYQPYPDFPATVDLRESTKAVIYGINAYDNYCAAVLIGDVNGDGTADLACGRGGADGPGNSRPQAGEIDVFYGRMPFPEDLDATEANLILYGYLYYAEFELRAVGDVNDDGFLEIMGLTDFSHDNRKPSVWMVSPYDSDGDGFTQLADNCPLVSNSDQTDSAGDGRGDACRTDWDGDGVADVQDCAPADAKQGKPPETAGVGFQPGSASVITWQAEILAGTFDISRGDLSLLSSTDFGACQNSRDPNLSDTSFTDPDRPSPSHGFFYLVRGRNAGCGGSGSWGLSSSGQERINFNPAACP